jgi:hypothetical protein
MVVGKQKIDTKRLSMSSEIIVLDREQDKVNVSPVENEDIFVITAAMDFYEGEKALTLSSDEDIPEEYRHVEKTQKKRRSSLSSLRNIKRKMTVFLDNYSWIAGPMS